jgi:hypothetical protein
MKHLHISGRRWFQRSYGNTYFSASALIDGEPTDTRIDYEYGYGDQYKQSMLQALEKNGEIPPRLYHDNGRPAEGDWQYTERTGIKITAEVADVARERDL